MNILCVGRLVIDVIVEEVNSLESLNPYNPLEGKIRFEPGGSAFHTSTFLNCLGHTVQIVAAIGDDFEGQMIVEKLRQLNINTETIRKQAGDVTPASIVRVDDHQRPSYILGTGYELSRNPNYLLESVSKEYDWIHLANISAYADQAKSQLGTILNRQRKTAGVSADMSKHIKTAKSVIQLCPEIDWLFGNIVEFQAVTETDIPEKIAQLLLGYGIRLGVVIKCGNNGAFCFTRDGQAIHIPGIEVPIQNEVGAGDVFCSVFIDSMLNDFSAYDCAATANRIATHHVGGKSFNDLVTLAKAHSVKVEASRVKNQLSPSEPYGFQLAPSSLDGERFDLAMQLSQPLIDQWVQRIIRAGNCDRHTLFLDAGCGTGRMTLPLYSALYSSSDESSRINSSSSRIDKRLIAIDSDESRLSVARSKVYQKFPDASMVAFSQQELNDINPCVAGMNRPFDCVLLSDVLSYIKQQHRKDIYKSISRIMRSGGRLLVKETPREFLHRSSWYRYFLRGAEYARILFPTVDSIIANARDSKLNLQRVDSFDDVESVDIDTLRLRFETRAFSWCGPYSPRYDEFDKELIQFLKEVSACGSLCIPSVLMVFEKA
ncbi:MAG: PfkB family carbohydrate kinase [Planctomycetaceae bacterium]|jgi:sugar/nucleoside kinase (ribokinase family)/ubiquinone/menaquinone biosynthesis C-methylase UbiE